MPGARDALCHQALQLLAELCARGALEHDSCQDFIYHLRDRARPRLRDPGECRRRCQARPEGPGLGVGAAPGPEEKSDANWREERGGHQPREGDQEPARSGLMPARTGRGPRRGLPRGGRVPVGWGRVGGTTPATCAPTAGSPGGVSRARSSGLHFPCSALCARGGRGGLVSRGRGDEAGETLGSWELGTAPACG